MNRKCVVRLEHNIVKNMGAGLQFGDFRRSRAFVFRQIIAHEKSPLKEGFFEPFSE